MKVFFINAVCGRGSTGQIVTDIAHVLEKNGDTFCIAYSHGTASNVDERHTVKIGSRLEYYVHNLLSRLTDHEGGYSRRATKQLVDKIRAFDPDVIHIHNTHGHWLNQKILFNYLAQCGKKIVWTLHDCWAFTGHCAHFTYVGCEKWRTGCHHCPQLHAYPCSYGRERSRKNYEEKRKLFTSIPDMTIVTPSEWLAGLVRESYLGKYPVKAIYNGLDIDRFRPTSGDFRLRYGLEGKKIILSVASVWMEKKGLLDILHLAEIIEDQYAIVMVGVTDVQKAMLPDNVIGIERTESVEELVQAYSAADVFVNLSYEETMGMVTAEALACGTPAIVYDATAVPEVVDKDCGIVVKAGDVQAVWEAIRKLEKTAYPHARKRAECFEKSKQFGEYVKLYQVNATE